MAVSWLTDFDYVGPMLRTTNRRLFFKTGFALGALACDNAAPVRSAERPHVAAELARIERQLGGRVGVFAFSPTIAASPTIAFRAQERFAMCSTFKWALVAQVLVQVDQGASSLATELAFDEQDILEYAPVARAAWANGQRSFSLEQCCQAAVTMSDNTAANLLLDRVGGPAGVTAFFSNVGDKLTHLDRVEPELNTNLPGDVRDTTTPRTMAHALAATLTADVLAVQSRDKLVRWLIDSPTGRDRLRAGFPAGLRAGDKTGTGNNGACNDVAIVWRATGEPLVVATYLSESTAALTDLKDAHRRVGALVAELL